MAAFTKRLDSKQSKHFRVTVHVIYFQGKYFYITPGICPSLSTMKAIVECAGGKVLSKQPSFRKLMEHKQNKVRAGRGRGSTPPPPVGVGRCLITGDPPSLVQSLSEIILISCENDLHLCREYFARGIGTAGCRRVSACGHGQARCRPKCCCRPCRCSQRGVCSDRSAHADAGLRVISFLKGAPRRAPVSALGA